MTLTDFLLTRIAEDESSARAAMVLSDLADQIAEVECDEFAQHIATWSPKRVLAECEAKRRIVAQERPAWDIDPDAHRVIRWVLATLALPYADHPDYDKSWRP